jgi:hypothetical protein
MPDWTKIKRTFEVDGVQYPTFRDAQKALAGQTRAQATPKLRSVLHAAAPHVAPEALDKMAEALAAKFNFTDRTALAEAARKRRAAQKTEAPAPQANVTQAPPVAA